jgi:uncharacterized protein YqiB (DUF1249 family)
MDNTRQPLYIAKMRAFEMNYVRIMQLVPDLLASGEPLLFSHSDGRGAIRMELVERSRYTSKLDLVHQIPALQGWIPDMRISVQVYHDAEVAEVIAYQKQERFRARNPYPNPQMHHRYEKAELNRFLTEWLDFCLKQLATGGMLAGS